MSVCFDMVELRHNSSRQRFFFDLFVIMKETMWPFSIIELLMEQSFMRKNLVQEQYYQRSSA